MATHTETVLSISMELMQGTERTIKASWDFVPASNGTDYVKYSDYFDIQWYWTDAKGDKHYRVAGNHYQSVGQDRESTYKVPDDAKKVYALVRAWFKPIQQNGWQNVYVTAGPYGLSPVGSFSFDASVEFPSVLTAPSVSVEKDTLTASVSNYAMFDNAWITFYLHQNNVKDPIVTTKKIQIITGYAAASFKISAGVEYKVAYRIDLWGTVSAKSQYSSIVTGAPSAPSSSNLNAKAISATSVTATWSKVKGAVKYEIEWTTDQKYFDSSNETQKMTVEDVDHAEITGMDTGERYYFRVRSYNKDDQESSWSRIFPSGGIRLGLVPSAPTTWSSTSTAMVGEDLMLYWTHNTEDGSAQVDAYIELEINGTKSMKYILQGTCATEASTSVKSVSAPTFGSGVSDGKIVRVEMQYNNSVESPTMNVNGSGTYPIQGDVYWTQGEVVVFEWKNSKWIIIERFAKLNTSSYKINTNEYKVGSVIRWRVSTRGLIDARSQYSVMRTVNVYAKPSLELVIIENDDAAEVVTTFPIKITATAGPATQIPIGYSMSVIANESYITHDEFGEEIWINKGDEIYNEYLNSSLSPFDMLLTPGDINLDPNISYRLKCVVSMDSGLTAEDTFDFTVRWTDEEYTPTMSMILDEDSVSMNLNPYCVDKSGKLVEDVLMSVYRREYDGTFTTIGENLQNVKNTFHTDPHPSLDFARYRIAATSKTTGAVSYVDIPGFYIGNPNVIIQWDEAWSSFDVNDSWDSFSAEPSWSGSMVKIPYNIDISSKNNNDVALVEYIGRKHPVSYYGTQVGETGSWSMEIPKSDRETLYALRRLQKWMGDVYVREPSGIGYWANISVSFSQNHCAMTIPVSMEVTRVEGGV